MHGYEAGGEVAVGLTDYNKAMAEYEDGEEWEDEYGFKFRRQGNEIQVLIGGEWVPWLWWMEGS